MGRNFLTRLSRIGFMKALLAAPAPRWMVLLADTMIVALSCILTFTYNTSAGLNYDDLTKVFIIVVTYMLTGLVFKSHWYIIRLSVIEDMYRLALHVSVSSLLLVLISVAVEVIAGDRYIGIWNIVIIAVFSFALMMCMRLMMKYFYTIITGVSNSRKSVIVLGSSINSFVYASALKNETEGQFEPVALLNVSGKKYDTTLNGIPILQFDEESVKEIFEKYNCDTLLFLSTQIEQIRSDFADVFLENHIKLLMLNQIAEFDLESNAKSLPNLSSHVRNIRIEDLLGRDTIQTDNPYIRQQIKNKSVLITGAAGSIGSEIVRQVASLGANTIILVDQAETPMHDMQLEMEASFPNIEIHLIIGDIAHNNRMEKVFSQYRPQYVFHAAAYKHVPMMEHNPSEAILTNVFGTKILVDLSVKYHVDKFVMISTDKAVKPTNIMGASKRIAEIYVQSLFFDLQKNGGNTRFITTRFGNVLGSSGSVIPRFSHQIEEGGPVTVTHREIIRYFMTIPEACSLVLEAGCMGNGGEIYIFDMGKPVKIYDLACRMITLAGLRPGEDIEIIETGLRPGEKLYEELLNDKECTIATHHKKIMIAKVQTYDYENVVESLERLYELAQDGDVHDLVMEMKHIVPEFHSQNSQWENIDKEIKEVSKD